MLFQEVDKKADAVLPGIQENQVEAAKIIPVEEYELKVHGKL